MEYLIVKEWMRQNPEQTQFELRCPLEDGKSAGEPLCARCQLENLLRTIKQSKEQP